jgi:hypothetical protein
LGDVSYSNASGAGETPMIEIDLDVRDFSSNWANCDLVSSYVSRMVCHNRLDSMLFANLYSSALNELMETAFHRHGNDGKVVCRFKRRENSDRIEIDMPGSEDIARFYDDAVALTKRPDKDAIYLDRLFSAEDPDRSLGLLELSVDYGAEFNLTRDQSNNRICLTADLVFEDNAS